MMYIWSVWLSTGERITSDSESSGLYTYFKNPDVRRVAITPLLATGKFDNGHRRRDTYQPMPTVSIHLQPGDTFEVFRQVTKSVLYGTKFARLVLALYPKPIEYPSALQSVTPDPVYLLISEETGASMLSTTKSL